MNAIAAMGQTNTNSSVSPIKDDDRPFIQKIYKDSTNIFNRGWIFEAGALLNNGKVGGFADIQYPTDDQISVGFGFAYLDKNFYDASISARLGKTIDMSFLGDLYIYLESGPAINLEHLDQILAQSFAGLLYKVDVTKHLTFTAGGAVGQITTIHGGIIAVGGSVCFH